MQALIHILHARHIATCPICGGGEKHHYAYPRVVEISRCQDGAKQPEPRTATPARPAAVPD